MRQISKVGSPKNLSIQIGGRLRPTLSDLPLIFAGFVAPLNETVNPTLLGAESTKIASFALAVLTLLFVLGKKRDVQQVRVDKLSVILIAVYFGLIIASSVLNWISIPRGQLLMVALVGFAAFVILDVNRTGSFFRIVYWAAVLHIFRSVIFGESGVVAAFEDRLTGGISPVFMGFEAVLVIGASLLYFGRQELSGRLLLCVIMFSALFVIIQSGSKAAWVSLVVSACFVYVNRQRGTRVSSIVSVGLSSSIVILLLLSSWGNLSEADQRDNLTATGRWRIWQAILETADQPLVGYGFAALRDYDGNDAHVFRATFGLPAENAFLNAYLMAGVVGAIILLGLVARLVFLLSRGVRLYNSPALIWMIFPVLINFMFSSGISGPGFQWWWLLALVGLVRTSTTTTRSLDKNALSPRKSKNP